MSDGDVPDLRVDADGMVVSYRGKHLNLPERYVGPYSTSNLCALRDDMAADIASLHARLSTLEAQLHELNQIITASKALDSQRGE